MPSPQKLSEPQTKQDLRLDSIPAIRRVLLDLRNIDPARISLMDAIDIALVTGIAADKFRITLAGVNGPERVRLLYAYAWVIARRVEPGLTWEEMQTYDLEITGSPPSKEEQEAERFRARTLVGVARTVGITPLEAGNLTMSQVDAALPSKQRRKRSA